MASNSILLACLCTSIGDIARIARLVESRAHDPANSKSEGGLGTVLLLRFCFWNIEQGVFTEANRQDEMGRG